MMELWKDIPGYEGAYQASNLGRIKSIDHYVNGRSRYGKQFKRLIKGRILRPGRYNKSGHLSVVLGRGTNGLQVHYLVALTFIGQRPLNNDVRHLDGNPENNRLDNLVYGTRTENIIDVYRQGKKWRKTSIEQALQIKRMLETDLKCTEIARIVGVNPSVVYEIKDNKIFWWLNEVGDINV